MTRRAREVNRREGAVCRRKFSMMRWSSRERGESVGKSRGVGMLGLGWGVGEEEGESFSRDKFNATFVGAFF